MDEAIATLVAVTGTTPELAAQYAQLADGDANQAVTLFFENNGADLAASTSSQLPPTSTSNQPGHAHDPINLDDDDENITDDNDPEITGFHRNSGRRQPPAPAAAAAPFEDDEAMARRLQEEMYGGGGVDEPLRAPIARQSETLVGAGADLPLSGSDYDAAVQERLRAFNSRTSRGMSFGMSN